ncbi:TPA_exp: Uncharacterized protein A8136_3980 [Trichophyton benhamiae CBS 112371]|uniref:RBR-type E3 ubiquitin transferase n=1 Tax=Arthroderma benhamiae (strain ATCC MYA-4681 / CBS 112371) TaxID=663331 RepID=D4B214_ARTBC|nr:uncharacterized protein ARB_02497 [Trichophyton benhamiae CBS 112371]EFE30575.1 hypothetical protein ARB_02497 [Trichophyton benhamiae CBS 112371]DAA73777.1 TPA_exp: Uncharacterized protein A8136_3980 [Trichophyton benhamiae CBS 112371]
MEHDLLIVVDATASMGQYLTALNTSIPQIISISALTGCFSRIGLLAYRDYCDAQLLEWSGWQEESKGAGANDTNILALAKSLEAAGGGDAPEAAKTALARAYELMRADAKTTLLFYTDAYPHFGAGEAPVRRGGHSYVPNGVLEKNALSEPSSYGGYGPNFVDWVAACKFMRKGEKPVQVFCLLSPSMSWKDCGHYNYLSTMTRGACMILENSIPGTISKVTIDLLLSWMGVEPANKAITKDTIEKDNSDEAAKKDALATLGRYKCVDYIKKLNHELDPRAEMYFPIALNSYGSCKNNSIEENVARVPMTPDIARKYLPKKDVPVTNFATAWTTDPAYRSLALKHINKIIEFDVRAIAVNPVFGSLWRTICSDRTCDSRQELLDVFSAEVGRLASAEDREQLKIWLEASYDYRAEVLELLDSVPKEEKFPCVYLDPTLDFTPTGAEAEDEFGKPITALTRVNLLEIGRSCDPSVLRRLGRILTQLTYVEREADLPEHIAASSNEDVPKIPMVLARGEYKRQFWRILLHLIVPGTMLSARPAALLAALSLRLGITPLTDVAERETLSFRNKWNDLDVPETWSVPCLNLLISADNAYIKRRAGLEEEPESPGRSKKKPTTLLKPNDRKLFEQLIAYRMLEVNLDSALAAKVGWTPGKTTAPLGPTVTCRECLYPRSVSIMDRNSKCGLCMYASQDTAYKKALHINVSMDDGPESPATWVECCIQTCRAQYVVYDVASLNVRAKCHYCRAQSANPPKPRQLHPDAPWIECIKCTNRFIWPVEYRPSSLRTSEFTCTHCNAGRETVVEIETTAKKISAENSYSWLICDNQNPETCPFTGRSLFNTISTYGTENFVSRMTLFPMTKGVLTLKGKKIQNTPELISTLQDLISRLKTIKENCSLCFSVFRPDMLNPACGRRGCLQRVCRDCLSGWYGLNSAGRILNVGALSCPFCRRLPSAKTLANYAMGVQAIANLSKAVEEKGTWIYAWCIACSSAKQFMERECARGAPPEVSNWNCPECVQREEELELERIAAENAAEVAATLREEIMAKRMSKVKPCPKCGVMTEKIAGCAHITCPVRHCKAEWCYFCGKHARNTDIYEHLNNVHGGIFDPEDEELVFTDEE